MPTPTDPAPPVTMADTGPAPSEKTLAEQELLVDALNPGRLSFVVPNGTRSIHVEFWPSGAYQGSKIRLADCPEENDPGIHAGSGSKFQTKECAGVRTGPANLTVSVAAGVATFDVSVVARIAPV